VTKRFQITEYCHSIVRAFGPDKHQLCIDATMGKGGDTVFLADLVGEEGMVIAMDIQEEAVASTRKALKERGLEKRTRLVLDGHENLDAYAEPETVDIIMFNFGYLPGGDHNLSTKANTSLTAVKKGLGLLKKGGLMSLCIYSGGDSGFEERDALLSFLPEIDSKKFIVISHDYINRGNNPPLPVVIVRL